MVQLVNYDTEIEDIFENENNCFPLNDVFLLLTFDCQFLTSFFSQDIFLIIKDDQIVNCHNTFLVFQNALQYL